MTLRTALSRFAAIAMASLAIASCKSSSTSVEVSKPETHVGATITTDTLKGTVKGTMLAGKTYYFTDDIVVNFGDTLLMQSGVSLIAIWDIAKTPASPQITVNGVFASLGTKAAPNYIGPPASLQGYDNVYAGLWGGIYGSPSSGDIVIKWTKLQSGGGAAGANALTPYKSGSHRYMVIFQSANANFIVEDSWFRGSIDDNVRTLGGHVSCMRNTFEFNGFNGGEGFNMKGPTVGDVAYNMFMGCGTNGPKCANTSPGAVPCTVNIYNNTIVNGGWRRVDAGRAGSSDIEAFARGSWYNNLTVNCYTGFRLVNDADIANVFYDNQYYYATSDSIQLSFYPLNGVQVKQPHDIAGATKQNNPKFVNYDVDQFAFYTTPKNSWPQAAADQPNAMNEVGTANFRLQATSPAIGKGVTAVTATTIPMMKVPTGGDFGATILPLGKDIGCYQMDGTGNQH